MHALTFQKSPRFVLILSVEQLSRLFNQYFSFPHASSQECPKLNSLYLGSRSYSVTLLIGKEETLTQYSKAC